MKKKVDVIMLSYRSKAPLLNTFLFLYSSEAARMLKLSMWEETIARVSIIFHANAKRDE